MADRRLGIVLDDCIARLRAGESVEDCLASYPEHRLALGPLLLAAADALTTPVRELSSERRLALRAGLMAAIARDAVTVHRPKAAPGLRRWLLVPAIAAALVLGLLVGFGKSQAPETAEAATLLTVLKGPVRVETGAGPVEGHSGMVLRAGDRVETDESSHAVLSFADGSSVTLDRYTSLEIRSIVRKSGQVQVSLNQTRGNTWTYVPSAVTRGQVQIDTPTAVVRSNQAEFSTSVDERGRTQVGAKSGSIDVAGSGKRTNLTAGQGTAIDASGVGAPAFNQPPQRELVVRVSGPSFSLLTDPDGSSAGVIAPGVPVNQLLGTSILRSRDQLTIRLANPQDGLYRLELQCSNPGLIMVTSDLAAAHDSTALSAQAGQFFALFLRVQGQSLALSPASRQESPVTAAGVAIPAEVVEKARASATAAAAGTSLPPRDPNPPLSATPNPTRTTSPPALTPTVRTSTTPGRTATAAPSSTETASATHPPAPASTETVSATPAPGVATETPSARPTAVATASPLARPEPGP